MAFAASPEVSVAVGYEVLDKVEEGPDFEAIIAASDDLCLEEYTVGCAETFLALILVAEVSVLADGFPLEARDVVVVLAGTD